MFDWFFKRRLKKARTEDIPYFGLDGQRMYVKLCDVYDGDSCTVVIKFCGQWYRVKCRLMGIDTAELRTKNDAEKEHAIKARTYMEQYLGKVLWADFGEDDKYGRAVVYLYETMDGPSINFMMVREGLAYEYYGQGKVSFEEWFKFSGGRALGQSEP